jgi:hypothetical protein
MKNIHLLPTDKPSKIFYIAENFHLEKGQLIEPKSYHNVYITSDEEIKEGDWFIANNGVHKCIRVDKNTSCPFITLNSKGEEIGHFKTWKTKIILATDEDLIKDGVQAIDDEFLEWFVKNPSCEEVEVEEESNTVEISNMLYTEFNYNIIIPKEEPKQETLEEAAFESSVDYKPFEDDLKPQKYYEYGFIKGAKWQQERSYSEENSNHLEWIYNRLIGFHNENPNYDYMIKLKTIIDQFKKK